MKYIKLELGNDTRYIADRCSYSFAREGGDNGALSTLGFFLTDDVHYSKDSIERWISLINSFSDDDSTESNYSFIEKDNGTIILGCQFDLFDDKVDFEQAYERAYANALRFKPQQLIDILNQWYELCSRKVQYIIITQDDENNFTITGKDFPDSPNSDN